MQQDSPTLRVTSRCSTREEFADFLRDLCDGNRVFIPSVRPQPVGIKQRFCITLADGAPMFAGTGVVLGTRDGTTDEFPRLELEIVSLEQGEELLNRVDDFDVPTILEMADWDDIETVVHDRTLAAGTRPTVPTEPGIGPASRAPRVVIGSPPLAVVERAPNPLVELDDEALAGFVESTLTEFPDLPEPPAPFDPTPFDVTPAGYTDPRPAIETSPPYQERLPRIDERPHDYTEEVHKRRGSRRGLVIGLIVTGALAAGVVIGNQMPAWLGSADEAPPPSAEATPAKQAPAETAPAAAQVPPEIDAGSTAAVAANTAGEADAGSVAIDAAVKSEAVADSTPDKGIEPSRCVVSVSGSPRRARVFAGKRSLGTTPLRAEVKCGEVTLRISGAGHKPETKTVVARADGPTEVSFDLERMMTSLRVMSAPPGATVRLRGRAVGKTPLTIPVPAFASSKVSVELDGYKKWSRNVRVGASAETIKAMLWPSQEGDADEASEDDASEDEAP